MLSHSRQNRFKILQHIINNSSRGGSINSLPLLYHSVGMSLRVHLRVNTPYSYIYVYCDVRWGNTDSFKCTNQTLHFLLFRHKNESSTPCFNLTDLLFLDSIF